MLIEEVLLKHGKELFKHVPEETLKLGIIFVMQKHPNLTEEYIDTVLRSEVEALLKTSYFKRMLIKQGYNKNRKFKIVDGQLVKKEE